MHDKPILLTGASGALGREFTVLYNGPLECRLYEFRMVAGSHRS